MVVVSNVKCAFEVNDKLTAFQKSQGRSLLETRGERGGDIVDDCCYGDGYWRFAWSCYDYLLFSALHFMALEAGFACVYYRLEGDIGIALLCDYWLGELGSTRLLVL